VGWAGGHWRPISLSSSLLCLLSLTIWSLLLASPSSFGLWVPRVSDMADPLLPPLDLVWLNLARSRVCRRLDLMWLNLARSRVCRRGVDAPVLAAARAWPYGREDAHVLGLAKGWALCDSARARCKECTSKQD